MAIPTVTTRLIGGLGNQMFQYAAARALAHRQGAGVALDLTGFENYALRRYELGSFPITLAPQDQASKGGPMTWLKTLLPRKPQAAPPVYREPHFHYDPALGGQRAPVTIDGYWQSERYFADIGDIIRREFTPTAPLEPENATVASAIRSAPNAVSIHVRRGDYVSNPQTNAVHGICSLDYYRAAVAALRARAGDPQLFVFSDDQEWTRANLAFDLPMTFAAANPPDRGFRDMQLMALCRHHVIANSSFSWWGAWLNPSPDKIVIAPSRWFADGERDTRDLLPAGWVTL